VASPPRVIRSLLVVVLLSLATPAWAQFASQYPGDVGIENDSRVIWVEKCAGTPGTIAGRYDNTIGSVSKSSDVPATAAPGTESCQFSGGGSVWLYRNLADIQAAGYTRVFLRGYVKYTGSSSYGGGHNGFWIIGQDPSSDFLPAQCCLLPPTSGKRFYFGVEPGSGPGADESLDAYTVFLGMRGSGIFDDGVVNGQPTDACIDAAHAHECYFGNTYVDDGVVIVRDTWHAIEAEILLNTPVTASNGELRLWKDNVSIVDLRLGSPTGSFNTNIWTTGAGSGFPGFQWRDASSPNLAVNGLWLKYDGTANPNGMRISNVVLAIERVGPMVAQGSDTTPPSAPSNLTAQAVASSGINLSWTASTDNVAVTGYRVLRCQGGGCTPSSQVGTPSGTTFSDTSLTANTLYRYAVVAVDATPNVSAASNTAQATTAPLTTWVVRFQDTQANGTNQETGFKVNRKFGTSGTWTLLTTAPASSGSGATVVVTDTTAERPVTCYQVAATNTGGDSALLGGDAGVCGTLAIATVPGIATNLQVVQP
jgi:hypothetical protein